jgi:site-specific DNA-methyltransferase (adenine-specific)
VIVDAPYSTVTHAGHDDGAVDANRGADMRARLVSRGGKSAHGGPGGGTGLRRSIDYPAWTATDVEAFVSTWHPLCRGWFVTITDHVLARAWETALSATGRYVFAPLPLYSPGSRVRLSGDGPSSWTCWIVVARPSNREFFQWGTLPGGYQCAPERMPIVGGKPLAAMRAIVADYTRPGDIVADPCMGAATTGLACMTQDRRFIGSDVDPAHVAIAAERLRSLPALPSKTGTLSLFGSTGT